MSRQKIYLVDVEHAKKEEFERRKKLRLQQVRQQAREIASLLRNRSSYARKKLGDLSKQQQVEAAVKSTNVLRKELQQKLSDCITSVGTAHSSAAVLSEVDELAQDKVVLQDSLARVRAALANEKAKDGRSSRPEIIRNVREGVSISKVQPGAQIIRNASSCKGSEKPVISVPATPPNLVERSSQRHYEKNEDSSETVQNAIRTMPVFTLPRVKSARPSKIGGTQGYSNGRQSCPPRTESVEDASSSSDSDDSGQTWPPASVKKKKSMNKVRMYDHSAKKCSEYVQRTGIVRSDVDGLSQGDVEPYAVDPMAPRRPEDARMGESARPANKELENESPGFSPPHNSRTSRNATRKDMTELIRNEEELHAKRADEISESRQIELERGLKALREEVAKRDFDKAIRDLCHFSKESRFRNAHEYLKKPIEEPPCPQDSQSEEKRMETIATQNWPFAQKETSHQKVESTGKHRPPGKSEEPVSSLISKLNEQREKLLHDSTSSHEALSMSSEDDTVDAHSSIPWWLKSQLETEMATAPETDDRPVRLPTPETVIGRMTKPAKDNSQRNESDGESCNKDADEQEETNYRRSVSKSDSERSATSAVVETPRRRKGVEFESQSSTTDSSKTGSGSSAGINVQIRISREKLPTVKRPAQPLVSEGDSSTSYYSPPENLSPAQVSVLSDILSKMSARNDNPILRHYIARLLNMSRRSLSDLEGSCSSEDVTIESDLFSQQSSPRRIVRPTKDMVDYRSEKENFSTACTLSSIPQTPSSEQSSGQGQIAKVAAVLRNILELQRIYSSHSSSQSSEMLSDSRSSYRDLPGHVESQGYRVPPNGDGLNFNDDTGLFNDHYGAAQRLLASLMSGRKVQIDVPPNLLPRPFAESSNRLPVPDDANRVATDSAQIAGDCGISKEQSKPVRSLSDIESIISSVQSTPTKKDLADQSYLGQAARTPLGTSNLSELQSGELISSREMRNDSFLDTISSSSSTSDIEEVFRSLGLGWALTTLRRMRNSRRLQVDSSSKSGQTSYEGHRSSKSSTAGSIPSYHHSTPVKETRDSTPRQSPDDAVPSLTPPDVALQCPSWKK